MRTQYNYIDNKIIISVPDGSTEIGGYNRMKNCGFFQTKGRKIQEIEDTLVIHEITDKDLTPANSTEKLNPNQIAKRLWTSLKVIGKPIYQFKSGTTAALIVFNGDSKIIAATIGDSVSFAVIYDKKGKAVSVTRLNSIIHSPDNLKEMNRVQAAGGSIAHDNGLFYVNDMLNMTRSLGDQDVNKRRGQDPIISDAQIDSTDIRDLPGYKPGRKVQIISCSDGFTAPKNCLASKIGQEMYLLQKLNANNATPGTETEDVLSARLVNEAFEDESPDHITLIAKTISIGHPTFTAVFDGHDGNESSVYAAKHIAEEFGSLCSMADDKYEQLEFSVSKHLAAYNRDNSDEILDQKHHVFDFDILMKNFPNISKPKAFKKPAGLSYEDQCSLFIIFSIINKIQEIARDKNTLSLILKNQDLTSLADVLSIFNKSTNEKDLKHISIIIAHANSAYLKAVLMCSENLKMDIPSVLGDLEGSAHKLINYIFTEYEDTSEFNVLLKLKELMKNPQTFAADMYFLHEKNLLTHCNFKILLTTENREQIKMIYNPDLNIFKFGDKLLVSGLASHYKDDKDRSWLRINFFKVSGTYFKHLHADAKSLSGDSLKMEIINFFKSHLEEFQKSDELEKYLETIEQTDEYKVLKAGRGLVTKVQDKTTSSIGDLQNMIAEKRAQLKAIEIEESASIYSLQF